MSRCSMSSKKYRSGIILALSASALGIALTACGSASSAATSSTSTEVTSTAVAKAGSDSFAGLNLTKLGSLTDYSAELVNNKVLTLTYRVHSPSDWESFMGSPQPLAINIGTSKYARVPSVSGSTLSYSWQKIGAADPYLSSPYPSEVKGFIGLTHVTGATLEKEGSCVVAGISGHQFKLVAKGGSIFSLKTAACVADSSGALLSFDEGSSGTEGPTGYTSAFAITGVNNVGVITVP
jgi:hypothetical protein